MTNPESFQSVPSLPLMTAYHECVTTQHSPHCMPIGVKHNFLTRTFGLGSFITRLRAESIPSVHKRFIDRNIDYALTVKKLTEVYKEGIIPSIRDYLTLRRETSVRVFQFMSPNQNFSTDQECRKSRPA